MSDGDNAFLANPSMHCACIFRRPKDFVPTELVKACAYHGKLADSLAEAQSRYEGANAHCATLGEQAEKLDAEAQRWADRYEKLRVYAGLYERALRAILADPHGCRFCDSGKLRNPEKDHDETCGYKLAQEAMETQAGGAGGPDSPSVEAPRRADAETDVVTPGVGNTGQVVEVGFFKRDGVFWRVVPADPTPTMLSFFNEAQHRGSMEERYDAMLKAAPLFPAVNSQGAKP